MSARLADLLDRREGYQGLPVIGPKAAAELQSYLDHDAPPLPQPSDIENMVGKLALVTKDGRVSSEEANERHALYWRGLREVPLAALHHAFDRLLQTATFFPSIAEIIDATKGSTVSIFSARRLVARTLLMKHRNEWRPPVDDMVSADEMTQVRTDIQDAVRRQREERLAVLDAQVDAAIERARRTKRYCPVCHFSLRNPAVMVCKADNCGFSADYQPGPLDGTYEEQEVAGGTGK